MTATANVSGGQGLTPREKDSASTIPGETQRAAFLIDTPDISARKLKKWRQYLANERAEAAVYRELARRREGEEREILLALAAAESRHEQHWRNLLGDEVGMPKPPDLSTRILGFLARHFGSVFVLALLQNAETRTPYTDETDATDQMSADEKVHAEVVRGLAARSRERMSGGFRAALFGLNDGLVSNLALVIGVVGTGLSSTAILLTGISGLLAGALSMAAGEFVSVSSQRELLEASAPQLDNSEVLSSLDVNANELALAYRARGMAAEEAEEKAASVLQRIAHQQVAPPALAGGRGGAAPVGVGSGATAAAASFTFFAMGAVVPIIPFFFGLATLTAAVIAVVLVGIVLMCTGAVVGVLSGSSPSRRAGRQLLLGLSAAGVTWLIGTLLGSAVGVG